MMMTRKRFKRVQRLRTMTILDSLRIQLWRPPQLENRFNRYESQTKFKHRLNQNLTLYRSPSRIPRQRHLICRQCRNRTSDYPVRLTSDTWCCHHRLLPTNSSCSRTTQSSKDSESRVMALRQTMHLKMASFKEGSLNLTHSRGKDFTRPTTTWCWIVRAIAIVSVQALKISASQTSQPTSPPRLIPIRNSKRIDKKCAKLKSTGKSLSSMIKIVEMPIIFINRYMVPRPNSLTHWCPNRLRKTYLPRRLMTAQR